jgi:5-formyltetrahydrofolate cyclo-ligase
MQSVPEDLRAWRKSRRAELIAARLALPREARASAYAAIASHLDALREVFPGKVVGFCWPFRGEVDLRKLVQSWIETGATGALPALAEKNTPMRFRRWSLHAPLTRGVWGIPIPDGTEELVPDIILIPVVGYDSEGYRLGYGGGYFDRMLADIAPPPLTLGIAIEQAHLETIYPQAYDMPMDCIVTEAGLHAAISGELRRLASGAAIEHLRDLAGNRSLPRPQNIAPEPPPIELSSPVCYAAEFPGYFGETVGDEKK